MRKSIFVRYFTVITSIILICLTILGTLLISFAAQYWVNDKQEMLTRNAKDMADILGELALKNQAQIQWNPQTKRYSLFFEEGFIPESMNAAILVMASASNSDVRIISPAGQVLLFATANDKMDPDEMLYKAIPADVAQKSLAGSSYPVGRLGDNYTETYYTAGEPIKAGEVGVIGAVLLSTPTGDLSGYIGDNLRMFLLAAVLVLILSFLATYALTYQMAKPLRQMVQAARKFGEGDFSAKIPVNNQDEVAELAVALNNMASSLASVEGMRRSFVANVSHELRTPMTTIGGFIDGILDGTIPEEKQEQYLRTVSDEIKRLSRLVRSMLDISRMEAGELKINPSLFSLSDMVMRVFFSCEKLINDKNIEVRGLEDLPEIHVKADPDRIHQIIFNLVDNAIKFTNEGGYIAISIREENGWVYFTIRNSGQGIARADLGKIFERFYKTDKSRGLDKKGVGLGLFIVRMLMQLHGGDITARSVEGEYAEFEFWLPAMKQEAEKPEKPAKIERTGKGEKSPKDAQ